LLALDMVGYARAVMPAAGEWQAVLQRAAQAPADGFVPAAALVQDLPPPRRAPVFRALSTLLKWGVLRTDARQVLAD